MRCGPEESDHNSACGRATRGVARASGDRVSSRIGVSLGDKSRRGRTGARAQGMPAPGLDPLAKSACGRRPGSGTGGHWPSLSLLRGMVQTGKRGPILLKIKATGRDKARGTLGGYVRQQDSEQGAAVAEYGC
jgi:hypothetical protein